jgi:hypothetical protein
MRRRPDFVLERRKRAKFLRQQTKQVFGAAALCIYGMLLMNCVQKDKRQNKEKEKGSI